MKFVSDIADYTNTYEEIEMKKILLLEEKIENNILYLEDDDDLHGKIIVCHYPNNLYILLETEGGDYHWADIDESSFLYYEFETKKEAIMEDYQDEAIGRTVKHYAFDSLGDLAEWMVVTF